MDIPETQKPNFLEENKPNSHKWPVAASYNVNNHICIMQKVRKQQAEGHKLAQYQLSN